MLVACCRTCPTSSRSSCSARSHHGHCSRWVGSAAPAELCAARLARVRCGAPCATASSQRARWRQPDTRRARRSGATRADSSCSSARATIVGKPASGSRRLRGGRQQAMSKNSSTNSQDEAQGGLQPRPASANWQICSGWLTSHTGLAFLVGGGRACAGSSRQHARPVRDHAAPNPDAGPNPNPSPSPSPNPNPNPNSNPKPNPNPNPNPDQVRGHAAAPGPRGRRPSAA